MAKTICTWSTRRDGNDGFVLEEISEPDNVTRIEYGPLPPHIVPSFVDARRRIVQIMLEKKGMSQVFDDSIPGTGNAIYDLPPRSTDPH